MATSGSIPSRSACDHAKISMLRFRKSISWQTRSFEREEPMYTFLSRCSSSKTTGVSYSTGSPLSMAASSLGSRTSTCNASFGFLVFKEET